MPKGGKTKKKSEKSKEPETLPDEVIEVDEAEIKLQMAMKNIGKNIMKEDDGEGNEMEGIESEGKKKKKGKDKKGKKKKKKEPVKTKYDLMREEIAKKDELKRQKIAEAKLKEEMIEKKQLQELEENEVRNKTLAESCKMLNDIYVERRDREASAREHDQWLKYLRCDGTPNVLDMREMNFYIYRWQNEPEPHTLQDVVAKFEQVLELISTLSDYIANPIHTPSHTLEVWRHLRHRLYKELINKVDKLTYNIIRNVRQNFQRISTFAGQLIFQTESFALALYSKYDISTCISSTDENIDLPIVVEFPEIGVTVYVPYQLMYKAYVVRVLYSTFDDYSILCATHEPIPMPDVYFRRDLYKYNEDKLIEKQRLRAQYEFEVKERKNKLKKNRQSQKILFKLAQSEKESGEEEEEQKAEESLFDDVLSIYSAISQADSDWDVPIIEPEVEEETEEITSKKKKGKKNKGKKKKNKDEDKAKVPVKVMSTYLLKKQELLKKQKEELEQLPPIPTPSEVFALKEEMNRKSLITYLQQNVKSQKTILNLRKYRVVGGVYHVNFIETVPQVKTLSDLSQVHVTCGEKTLKHIDINMNTNHVIKQVYNKYRERFNHSTKKKENKNVQKKEVEDRKRIQKSLNTISDQIERRKTAEVKQQQQNDQTSDVVFEEPISKQSKPLEEERDTFRVSTSSSKKSVQSIHSDEQNENFEDEGVQLGASEEGEDDDKQDIVSTEGSVDSFKSRDSMFEEYIVETYDSVNFKPKIKIHLPKHVLYFKKPFPVIWNFKKKAWYFNDYRLLSDIQYEDTEEGGGYESVTFRYTKTAPPLALAVQRYGPLPFTSFQLFPDTSKSPVESVTFLLASESVTMEFEVKPFLICLKAIDIKLENQNTHILDDEIGKFYKPMRLIRKMRRVGIDIFPDHDTFIYIDGLTPKHYINENHTYRCMALLCSTHAFLSSKWNKTTSNIIMNVKEQITCNRFYTYDYSLCLINTDRAVILDCTEDSDILDENYPEQQFCPDLYWLMQANSCTSTTERVRNVNTELADTVYLMLCKTLIITFT